jgi:hypothetical protein
VTERWEKVKGSENVGERGGDMVPAIVGDWPSEGGISEIKVVWLDVFYISGDSEGCLEVGWIAGVEEAQKLS